MGFFRSLKQGFEEGWGDPEERANRRLLTFFALLALGAAIILVAR